MSVGLNNLGRPIHPEAAGIENFWRWFGKSALVDRFGRPLVVFHGTTSDFHAFAMPPRAKSMAAYFSDSSSYAAFYTRGPRLDHEGGNIVPVYLKIANPYRVQDDWAPAEWPSDTSERRRLIARGHDGIVWTDPDSNETMWIAFDPRQVKSAIGNDGRFDPEDVSIVGACGPERARSAIAWIRARSIADAAAAPMVRLRSEIRAR